MHSGVNDDVEWGAVDLPSLRGDHDGARPARGLISARRRNRTTRRRHDEGVGAPQVTIRLVIGPNDIGDGRSERGSAYGQPRGDRHERARVEVGWPEDPHGRGNEDGWIDRGRGCYEDGDSITLAAQREFAHGSEVRCSRPALGGSPRAHRHADATNHRLPRTVDHHRGERGDAGHRHVQHASPAEQSVETRQSHTVSVDGRPAASGDLRWSRR